MGVATIKTFRSQPAAAVTPVVGSADTACPVNVVVVCAGNKRDAGPMVVAPETVEVTTELVTSIVAVNVDQALRASGVVE